MEQRKFLVITNASGSAKRAIPIENIIRILEFQDAKQTIIDYYRNKEEERVYARESFDSIMAGNHTVVL